MAGFGGYGKGQTGPSKRIRKNLRDDLRLLKKPRFDTVWGIYYWGQGVKQSEKDPEKTVSLRSGVRDSSPQSGRNWYDNGRNTYSYTGVVRLCIHLDDETCQHPTFNVEPLGTDGEKAVRRQKNKARDREIPQSVWECNPILDYWK